MSLTFKHLQYSRRYRTCYYFLICFILNPLNINNVSISLFCREIFISPLKFLIVFRDDNLSHSVVLWITQITLQPHLICMIFPSTKHEQRIGSFARII